MKLSRFFAVLVLLSMPAVASSQAGGDPVVINPAKAYIFVRVEQSGAMIRFLRERAPGEGAGTPAPFPDPRSWLQVSGRRFTSGREGGSFLREVEPGSYILYGGIGTSGGVHLGLCLCMGSVRFEARAGQITDIGEIRYPERGAPLPAGFTLVPYNASMRIPAQLISLPRVPAEIHAAGKMPNYFGVGIGRHNPVPGILAYRRDQPIDVRTGRDVPPSGD
jgi:hypothetical protein